MKNATLKQLSRAEIWLSITILMYFLMNGAQIFETLVFVPKWTTSPPFNFNLLLDGHGTSLKIFWIVLHSLHEIAFLLTIVFCWRFSPIRNWLLILFAIHFGVRVWTLMYFAQNIIEFQNMANGDFSESNLLSKVTLWKNLNYIRVGLFMMVSFGIIPLWYQLQQFKISKLISTQ
jgi:hypothetical protein